MRVYHLKQKSDHSSIGGGVVKVLQILVIFLCLTAHHLQAQTQEKLLSGVVYGGDGNEPIPGATVLIKGTEKGTVTDLDGRFQVRIDQETEQSLVISFVGFKTREIIIGNQTNLTISLEEDVASLEEVVVIGYGSQKKKLLTGATVNVDGDALQNLSNTNALQSLQGKTAGVNITSNTGQPGAGFEVNIRGVGTIGKSNPLYIVDGLPVNDISYLNNADIASIDILKDAAAAAIYGARAANGVVLITTRQGTPGKARLSFDAYYGLQTVTNKLDLLNASEYATIMNEQGINSGKQPYYTNQEIAALGKGTNWLDQILVDNAATQNYSLALQGGGENSVYSTSLSYTQQEGVVGGPKYSNYERYVFRINSEHKLYNDLLTVGENLTFSYVDQVGIADQGQYYNHFRGAFNAHPLMPVYDSLGGFYNNASSAFIDGGSQSNPYASLVYSNQKKGGNQRLVGNMFLQAEPIKGLKFRTTFGILHGTKEERSYTPVYELSIYNFVDTSTVEQSFEKSLTWNWENTLNFGKTIGQHNFEVLAGISVQKWDSTKLSATNANLSFDDIKYAYIGNTTYSNGPRMTMDGSAYEDALQSYFGRVLYNYQEKYMLMAAFRADGSAKFAKGYRWGYFPSVSAGWVLSNEGFLQSVRSLTFLKLRASWGQNGSNFADGFQYLAPITLSNTNYIFGNSEGNLAPGAYPRRLSNQKIKWETSEQLNIGVDAELLNGKLQANADVYKKTTKDWLIQAPILATAGAEPPFINGGNVVNQGIELALTWRETKGAFDYSISANAAYNENKVNSIPTEDQVVHGESNGLWNNAPEFYRAEAGLPIGYFWGYETLGVFQGESDISNHVNNEGGLLQPKAQPGDLIIKDTDGNGVINSNDKTNIGDPNPDLVYGFTLSGSYKGFDLIVNANGVAGNQLVQSFRSATDQYSNYPKTILGRWHGEGTSDQLPRVTEDGKNYTIFSDIYVKDGDFLRINNITLGYDFAKMLKSQFVSQLRFYLTAQNILTLTKYTGMDPEIGYGPSFTRGVDLGYYPRPRVLMAGLNVKF